MERIISEDERIRRAEIVRERRKNRIPVNNINVNHKKKMSLLTKTFIQVVSSIIIFGIIYLINQNNSMAFETVKPYVSSDIDFVKLYSKLNDTVKNLSSNLKENQFILNSSNEIDNLDSNDANSDSENNDLLAMSQSNTSEEKQNLENNLEVDQNEINTKSNTDENLKNNTINSNQETNGIGGGSDGEELSQEEQDIAYIKANANFIKPITGRITSGFGTRTPTDVVTANHSGVDIGAEYGADIVASMEGIVELVSNEGDYGNHLKITNGSITTLYAHCSKIIVNEGEHITQGQKIAEVGSTGRSTGPHLHFEIRRENRAIDPQKILDL